ncbi:MAG: DEAD/DEAH box helicase family protein [Gammaproteobacteria bacterium]|nr:DEAD/DEAH box helicase family protein [Gammaproteobacteria bacterium]
MDLASINHRSPPDRKIALFRSLFLGREDVYPRRFESRTSGRSGYAPACAHEWVPGVCEKPRIKCAECPNRQFLPVTEDEIRWHLSGVDDQGSAFVMGIYPMLLDETCHFVAVDFDGRTWAADALAYSFACQDNGVPAALERSRSGNGGHVWTFFDQAVPAGLARRLGAMLLTDAMDRRPDLGFRSYDRFFPSQDTLPRGGFGNLIALPLQRAPRRVGNSVFIDDDLQPHADQWEFLAAVERMSLACTESMVRTAEDRGRVVGVRAVAEDEDFAKEPWLAPPSRTSASPAIIGSLPENVELTLGDRVYIAKAGLPPGLIARLMRLGAFQNPEFYRAQAMRLPTYDKPRIVDCVEDGSKYLGLPRGCLEATEEMLHELGIETSTEDQRCLGKAIAATFRGDLRPDQDTAARSLAAHDTGVLAAATAFGKTVVAAWLIARRGVNTLVVVHREQLLEQWIDRLSEFLDIGEARFGRFSGRKKELNGAVDVASMQSLVRKGHVDDRVADYGFVIVDECHHVPARSFELVTSRAKAKYVTGLTATVTRKDGHHPIMFLHCGPIRHRAERPVQHVGGSFSRRVIVRPTGFRASGDPEPDLRVEFQRLCGQLIADPGRNSAICREVADSIRDGRSPLVLTERIDHLDDLAGRFADAALDVVSLRGGMTRKALTSELARITRDQSQVVLATGRFVGEGFDQPHLDTLFLTMPISWRGTVTQYVGRLHRLHEGKREVRVYDYVDLDAPMLARMFDRRCRAYEAQGYAIERPASAVPGWPAEIELPAHDRWKQQFQSGVSRLARDGVDAHAARLFLELVDEVTTNDGDVSRVRSASEAFLLQRLQDNPATRDRFRSNAHLPIPFCERGDMEVDFLDADARVVIELDGPQHLSDPDAYRRDRRKDALLQENGYLVLRFLAEDLGTRLNDVLDEILRGLANRMGSDARSSGELRTLTPGSARSAG